MHKKCHKTNFKNNLFRLRYLYIFVYEDLPINLKYFNNCYNQQKKMINTKSFFDIENLKKGSQRVIQCIQKHYEQEANRKVDPEVTPGFLKKQIESIPPEEGTPIEEVISTIEKHVLPGHFFLQSPKYFGHFSQTISDTTVIAEMLAAAFHTPGCLYFFSPSYAELENIVVDWAAYAINIPEKFTFKSSGGGIINPSATESLFTVVNAAKVRKMNQLGISTNDAKITKFVGYYSQFCHKSAQKALILKDIYHRRVIKCFYNQNSKNFQIDSKNFQQVIKQDIENGLIPFWFGGTYGSTLTSAIDLNQQVMNIAKKYNMWLSIDAVYLGSSLILPQNQPQPDFFEKADSIMVNFSKNLLVGCGGSLLFVGDRKEFSQAITKKIDVSYYENDYTNEAEVTDYTDWTVGFDRRLNFFKLYFLFKHYGLNKLRALIRQIELKTKFFRSLVESEPNLFEVFSHKFSLLCFRVKEPTSGKPSNQLTQRVIQKVKNSEKGYCTPGQLNEYRFIRLNFGNILSTEEHLLDYFEQIKTVATQVQKRQPSSNPEDLD